MLAQVLPAGSRVAIIADPEHPGEQAEFRTSKSAAQETGLRLGYFPCAAWTSSTRHSGAWPGDGTQALVVFPDAFTLDQREKIAAFGLKQKLPAVSGWSLFADSGFLMSYGPNLRDSYAHLGRPTSTDHQRRETRRLADRAADFRGIRGQREDCEGHRSEAAAGHARPRRPGHRVTGLCPRVPFSLASRFPALAIANGALGEPVLVPR